VAPDTAPGRREANKRRTRQALVDALFRLLGTDSLDQLTAERVADAAGISRRTFFNYFPSVEAVLAHRQQELLDQLRTALVRRPADEPLLDGVHAVIDELFTVELLAEATRLWRTIDLSPAAGRYALEVFQDALVDLGRDWAARRLSGTDPDELRLAVLTASCLAAFDAACRSWLDDHPGPVDAAARAAFVARVRRAFEYLRPVVEPPMTAAPLSPDALPEEPVN
jgi:AcrR family transcriptional regulator